MEEFIKKNFAVLLAFVLPILLIVIVALSTYLPSLFLSTKYNFIYTSCADGGNYYSYPYYCDTYLQKRYSVVDNKLVVYPIDLTQDSNKDGVPDFSGKYPARIFLHDTQKNESREITLAEAQMLALNNLLTSPDGVTVSSGYNYNGGGDFFFLFGSGRSSHSHYLMKGKSKSKLNLINSSDQYYYQNNFQFLSWVLPGRN
ncbi:hypothetical protein A3H53_01650 [Candidatus Nomurabacteria bacterium RIFCSPLOWO2_02_FULL_40_10]|uniref:Uncharacterized protein n=1 Tax=Candidatus Nomurabacteria bacterium RIFCSPLOWO2_02_FULL_40_10 TaxID=1801786 RepID=A0A1F6Y137_9BACT|nr:MAG: hypothetical protein A3H53_01650 [Candidatus Nomurabacteria bacterium RIFCSPLOWO2_02_FULL_40_10]